ncbi:IS1182 family transposase [Chryseobacterium sp.]|uniref:IS1182 family transposase n=1 Tax=Chryseobacterium sp. TaxID=1871047 RepID=UPI00333F49A1
MQGKKFYQEKLFIQFQLSDYIPQDNFYKKLKDIIDFDFLYTLTSKYYGSQGQKSIDPVVFMKLMLVGYLENLNSDRRIISTSRMRMDILYFIGYDLDEELPWHSTLSRTRQLYGEEVFTSIFKCILKQCVERGLVSGKRQAVDSVFVKANASLASMVEKEVLDDVSVYTQELINNEEEVPIRKLPLKDRKVKRSNKTHISPADPDSRMSVKPGKVTRLNYLAQVSVDTRKHVITHIQAFQSDKGDAYCLPELVHHVHNNLKETGLQLREILADNGYSSGKALKFLSENNIIAYIPNSGKYKFNRDGFTYDKSNDSYICSQGKLLTFRHFRTDSHNTYKIYKTSVKDCKNCPLKGNCANSVGVKALEDTISKHLYDEMHLRMKTPKGIKMRKLRSSTVEPVIGTLVNFTAMSKVLTKGIKLANKCMIMAAVAYNLKKLVLTNKTPLQKLRPKIITYLQGITDFLREWLFNHTAYIL